MAELSRELIIPIYLNQRAVFDLIAMLQGGISNVTRITSSEAHSGKDQQQYGAAFGLSKAFSTLLKIDVSGSRHKAKEDSTGIQKAEERVHTPASMFQALRSHLSENKELALVDDNYKPKIRDIIEFDAQLRKNPIIQTMDAFVGIMDMAILFSPAHGQKQKAGLVMWMRENSRGKRILGVKSLSLTKGAGHKKSLQSKLFPFCYMPSRKSAKARSS